MRDQGQHHFARTSFAEADVFRRGMSGNSVRVRSFRRFENNYFRELQEERISGGNHIEVWRQIAVLQVILFRKDIRHRMRLKVLRVCILGHIIR
ncbi:MAG: hypothetical protein IPN61_10955 [Bacteroidetes bacterium]|nr:hypothetical protein [Bacteroidota bacterium]